MNVFLSHASEDKEIAEQIQLALVGAGIDVFFDAESLPAGGDYHARIRKAVKNTDLFVFLISNHSIAKGSYCLSELTLARERWPHPKGRVIPVRIGSVSFDQIPNYLRAVTILEPDGSIPADVLSVVTQTRPATVSASKVKWLPLLALPILAGTVWRNVRAYDCVSVSSSQGWQRFNLSRIVSRVTSVNGGWSVDARNYGQVGSMGHTGRDAEVLSPYNQAKFDQRFPFGALLMSDSQGVMWIQGPTTFSAPLNVINMRINDADKSLDDNGGSLKVCFGG